MKNIVKCIVILFLVGVFATPTFASIPGWAKVPNKDTENVIWGIGKGKTFDQGRRKALSSSARKINKKVKKILREVYQKRDNDVFRTYNVSAKITISDLDKIQYKIVKSSQKDTLYWIEVKLDKKNIANHIFKKWQLIHLDIEKQMSIHHQLSSIEQLVRAPVWLKKIKKAEMMIFQIEFLNKKKKFPEELMFYSNSYRSLLNIQDSSEIFFVGEGTSEEFKTVLKQQLMKSGLKLSNDYQKDVGLLDKSSIEIVTDMKLDQDDRGAFLCSMKLDIISYNDNRKIIANSEYFVKGRSYDDESDAIKKAASSLRTKLKRLSLDEILNINY